MYRIFEAVTWLDWTAYPRMIFWNFIRADWRGAMQRWGPLGVIIEAFSSLIGWNTYPFWVRAQGGWSADDIRRLLQQHGIDMWGVFYLDGIMSLHVKRRQAEWAQYVMRRAGVPLVGPHLAETAELIARGREPRQSSPGAAELAPRPTPRAGGSLLDRVDHAIDRIAGLDS